MLFTTEGIINIKNKKWEDDFKPLDPGLQNEVSLTYSKAFLRHLFTAKEILGLQIAILQNLCFYRWLMQEARKQITEGTFGPWKTKVSKKVMQRI